MSDLYIPRQEQPRMIEWCLSRDRSALFATPGKGKTAVVLTVLDELMATGASRGALIVAPIRVCSITWPVQVAKWSHTKWMKVAHLRTPEGLKAWDEGSADIYLVNPEQLPSYEIRRSCPACMTKCVACKGKGKITTGTGRNIRSETCQSCLSLRYVPNAAEIARKAAGIPCPKCGGRWMTKVKRTGLAEKMFRKRKEIPVDTFVWDELSLACNHAAKSVASIRPFLPMFKQRIGLTGTPVPNSYLDLFSQINLLDDGQRLGAAFTRFRSTYFEQEPYKEYSYVIRPGAKEAIDKKLSDLCLVVTGDDDDLPASCTHDIEVTLPAEAKKQYATLEKQLLLELKRSNLTEATVVASSAATLSIKLRQLVSGLVYSEDREVLHVHDAKLDALKKLRKKHGTEPILVLTEFIHETDAILAGVSGARKFHEKDIGAWQRGEILTWVANPRSMSHGIDGLQVGGRIICWFTLGYSNQAYVQTNKRIHRPGQTADTLIYRLICSNTIDDAVVAALSEKEGTERGLMAALRNLQTLRENTPTP